MGNRSIAAIDASETAPAPSLPQIRRRWVSEETLGQDALVEQVGQVLVKIDRAARRIGESPNNLDGTSDAVEGDLRSLVGLMVALERTDDILAVLKK